MRRRVTRLCVTLLMLDALLVCVGLAHGWNMWACIVCYWAILTVKNGMDMAKRRED